MSQDSFTKEFVKLREMGEKTFVLRGSTIIVEILPPEEIKIGNTNLVMATDSSHTRGGSATNHRVDVGRVLMCGQGYWTDTPVGVPLSSDDSKEETAEKTKYAMWEHKERFEPLEVQPGAIILLPQYSLQLLSHFPGIQRGTGNKLGMVKMDNILAYYPNEEAYNLAKTLLNG